MSRLQQKLKELEELEAKMNSVFEEVDALEKEEAQEEEIEVPEEELTLEDITGIDEKLPDRKDEAVRFLGSDPARLSSQELMLNYEITSRIKFWLTKGITEKEEKENLLRSIPRKGQLNLEAPILNEEIRVHLQSSALVRDKYFCEYQNLTGSALSGVSSVLNGVLNDWEEPLERDVILKHLSNSVKLLSHLFFSLTQSRKVFLLGRFEEAIQKTLKEIEPTTQLFGDNLKDVIDSSKAMEKVAKDLKPKPKPLPKQNTLNWRSPSANRGPGRGGYRNNSSRPESYKANNNRAARLNPYPAKRYYSQSQPQQQGRR